MFLKIDEASLQSEELIPKSATNSKVYNNEDIIPETQNCQFGTFSENDNNTFKALHIPYYGPYGESYKEEFNVKFTSSCVNTLEIHPVAKSLHEYNLRDLIISIRDEGQLDPILVWRNPKTRRLMVVNGRHRMWACNVLGIKVHTTEIKCNEKALPKKILDQQLLSRGMDRIFATITLAEYLETNKGTAKDLVAQYKNLGIATRDIGDVKTIQRIMPLWIIQLKLGKGIKIPGSGHATVKSLRALAKACKELEKEASIIPDNPDISDNTTPEGIALAKLVNTLSTVLDNADSLLTTDAKLWALKTVSNNLSSNY